MKRAECLDSAKEIVTKDRQSQYGGLEDNFNTIARYWSVYLGKDICSFDVSMMMILLKLARQKANPTYEDNYVDIAGYAACGVETATEHKEELGNW